MKKHIVNLFAFALLASGIFSSCDTDAEKTFYNAEKVEYAFAGTLQKTEMLPEDGNKIIVPIYRNTTEGASTLNLSMEMSENAEGLFALATPTVTFEEGAGIANAEITYQDINTLGVTDVYEFELTFSEELASPSQVNTIEVSAQRRLTYKQIGVGTFASTIFGSEDGSPEVWEQPIEKAEEAEVYRLPDCYFTGYPITFSLDEQGNVLPFPDQKTGYVHSTYGMTYLNFIEANKKGNTFYFHVNFIVEAGSFGDYVEAITFPEQ